MPAFQPSQGGRGHVDASLHFAAPVYHHLATLVYNTKHNTTNNSNNRPNNNNNDNTNSNKNNNSNNNNSSDCKHSNN